MSVSSGTAEIHASPILPIFLYQSGFSQHPDELGLVCVKTRAEPELGISGGMIVRRHASERTKAA
jgi:hypothetical protein